MLKDCGCRLPRGLNAHVGAHYIWVHDFLGRPCCASQPLSKQCDPAPDFRGDGQRVFSMTPSATPCLDLVYDGSHLKPINKLICCPRYSDVGGSSSQYSGETTLSRALLNQRERNWQILV